MKIDILMNGNIQIVLSAETEMEKLACEMLSKQEVEITLINKATNILHKQVHNGLVIKPKSRTEQKEEEVSNDLPGER